MNNEQRKIFKGKKKFASTKKNSRILSNIVSFAQICPKLAKMAKSFHFWQTILEKAKFGRLAFFKGQMATLGR